MTRVSIIVPVRNEADFIERCLHTIIKQDYPADLIEIIVVDGLSDDGTREIVQRLAADDQRVQLIDNPEQIVPFAMNRAINASSGDVIIRVDGHAEIEPDFVSACVRVLDAHPECWCVGGAINSINETAVGQIIAAAMSSPVGVGNARFRLGDYEGYVDTLAFGAYRREAFDKIGLFDEELVRNQDDELNARLIQHGGKIFLSPQIRSRYYPRTSLRKLWRQYYQYGFWRIRTIQKLGRPATLRQMVPLLFVVGLIALSLAAPLHPFARLAMAGYCAAYASGVLLGTLQLLVRTRRLSSLIIGPTVFAILHFGYGLGCLIGVGWFVILRRGPVQHEMSR